MGEHIIGVVHHYFQQHGYLTVAVALLLENAGVPVPGETILLLAGFFTYSEHQVRLPYVILVGIAAATLSVNGRFTLVPAAELILNKRRILELYLNVVEWGPGVYGAEAAAQYHCKIPAARVYRDQAARLAAILPSPLRRTPARMNEYSTVILERMAKMGW